MNYKKKGSHRNTNNNSTASSHENYTKFEDENTHAKHNNHKSAFVSIGSSSSTTTGPKSNINEEEGVWEEIEDFDYDDVEIQRDAANDVVAFMVYASLAFFMILFFGMTIGIIIIVGQYGFFLMLIIGTLFVSFLCFVWFLLQTLERDRVMKPMKRKIRRWHAIATAVVVNEFKNLQMDLNDHLLLTYDPDYDNDNDDGDDDNGTNNHNNAQDTSSRNKKFKKSKNRRGPRSRIFGLFIQPLLKKKNGKNRFGSRKKKKEEAAANVNVPESDDYAFV